VVNLEEINKEIESILLFDKEMCLECVRELLMQDYRSTYDAVFLALEEIIKADVESDIEVAILNIENIVANDNNIEHYKKIISCVRRANYNIFNSRNLNDTPFLKGIRLRLIDINRLLKEKEKKYIANIFSRIVTEKADSYNNKNNGSIDLSTLEKKYHVSLKIHDEVLEELEKIYIDKTGRRRFNSNFITIDGEDALCLDDALSLTKNRDGSYYYDVAFSDIPSIVPYKSKLYYEAYKRVETLYLCDTVSSLFPEKISNNLGSLLPGLDRNVLVYRFLVEPNFDVDPESLEIFKGVINVNSKLSYHDVNYWINMDSNTITMVQKAYEVSMKLRNLTSNKEKYRRLENIIKPEAHYHHSIFVDESFSANIIQEAMVLVNSAAPEYLHKKGFVYLYRNHMIPPSIMEDEEIIKVMNLSPDKYKEYKELIRFICEKCLIAYYSNIPEGHTGLGKKYYSHSSAGARRFGDAYNQYLTYEQLFNCNISDKRLHELDDETKAVADYINAKKKENGEFERIYNGLSAKGLILKK